MMCPNQDDFKIITCHTSEANRIVWTYISKVTNATTVLSPDMSLMGNVIAYRSETVAFVTNTNITATSIYSEIHLNLYDYLLPVQVTCSTKSVAHTRRFLPMGKDVMSFVSLRDRI